MFQRPIPVRGSGRLFLLLAGLAAIPLPGCGGDAGVSISGEIKVNGERLNSGQITYRPLAAGAGNGGGAKVVDGRYELDHVPLGKSVFQFSGAKLTGKSITGPGGQPEPERVNVIPQRILTEGVERDVQSGGTQDFALEGPA